MSLRRRINAIETAIGTAAIPSCPTCGKRIEAADRIGGELSCIHCGGKLGDVPDPLKVFDGVTDEPPATPARQQA